jgi:hypothetical protein
VLYTALLSGDRRQDILDRSGSEQPDAVLAAVLLAFAAHGPLEHKRVRRRLASSYNPTFCFSSCASTIFKVMRMQYQTFRSVSDTHVFVVCRDGSDSTTSKALAKAEGDAFRQVLRRQ